MKKKAAKTTAKTRTALHVWCNPEELELFDQTAKREGFNNRSAWVMWNLRRAAKQSASEDSK